MQCQVKERHAGTLYVCCSCSLTELCRRSLPDPMGCSPLASSIRGISWARILEWVAMLSSRGSSRPRGRNPHLLHCRWILYRPAQLMVTSVPFERKFAPFSHIHSFLWLSVPSPPDMSLFQNLFMPPSCDAMVFAEQSGKILKESRWKHYFSKQDTLWHPLDIGGIHKVNKLLRDSPSAQLPFRVVSNYLCKNGCLRDLPDGPAFGSLPSNPGAAGSIPGQGTQIPHSWPKHKAGEIL